MDADGNEADLTPASPELLSRGDRISDVHVQDERTLRILFDSRWTLELRDESDQYESFTIVGDDINIIV